MQHSLPIMLHLDFERARSSTTGNAGIQPRATDRQSSSRSAGSESAIRKNWQHDTRPLADEKPGELHFGLKPESRVCVDRLSTCGPGTRTNSRSLLVTRIQPSARAWAVSQREVVVADGLPRFVRAGANMSAMFVGGFGQRINRDQLFQLGDTGQRAFVRLPFLGAETQFAEGNDRHRQFATGMPGKRSQTAGGLCLAM